MIKVSDYDFNLPEHLIAQTPLSERANSRLMVINKEQNTVEQTYFYDIERFLTPGDCLVFNDTKVLPARLYGRKLETGAVIEVLLLQPLEKNNWKVLIKPAKRIKAGTQLSFGNGELQATCIAEAADGERTLEFFYTGIFLEILAKLGEMPLPPYIKKQLVDKDRYQTVYAKYEGSIAAPTAGLHFTNEVLERLKQKKIKLAFITLHVGLGTFRPVMTESILDHNMHEEYYSISEATAQLIRDVKKKGHKIYAVGTTTTRTLETVARQNNGEIIAGSGWTNIFIFPGYKFQLIDGLITNFHLPKSTLLMLIAALIGYDRCLEVYNLAIKEQYRFFSFGDSMLIH